MANKRNGKSDRPQPDVTLALDAQELARQKATGGKDGNAETIGPSQMNLDTDSGTPPGLQATIGLPGSAAPSLSSSQSLNDVTGVFTNVASSATGDFTFDQFSVPTATPSSQPPIPKRVGGYQIVGLLGRGGMGVVYHAKHIKLGREVALKMVLAGGHASPEQLKRFILEAQAVAHLQHPNIVQIFEVSEHEGLPYFSLEYVDGEPLDVQLRKQLPEANEAARLMATLAVAMKYAHDHGILHRDLKPANVLMARDGTPKVADFGLAKKLEDADDSASTRTGTVMGTPSYMSPEQASGQIRELGPATDQYSLGAMLYELLTGRPPFLGAKPIETILQVVRDEPIPPSKLRPKCPADLETICLKALQKSPAQRYASCAEFADDLLRYLAGEPILARPVAMPERIWRWCRRNPKIAIPSAAAILMMLIATTVSTWSYMTVSAKNLEIQSERDFARNQEKIAKEQQSLAESRERVARQQSKLALDSLQFVQTDIDNKLKPLPGMAEVRIALMRAMADKWKELEVKLTGNEGDATGEHGEAIATLMASQGRTAESLMQLGQVQEADELYARLVAQAEQRVVLMEGVDAARFNLAYLCNQRSNTQSKLNSDPQVAIDLNLRALSLMDDIKAHPKPKVYDPATDDKTPEQREKDRNDLNEGINSIHASILSSLGSSFLGLGKLPQSAKYFTGAYELGEANLSTIRSRPNFASLNEAERDNLTAARQLSLDTSGLALAYIYLRLGRTEESIARYEAAIAGRREIVERRPTVAALQQGLAGFLGNYGNAYLWLDRPQDAKPLIEESLQRQQALRAEDPKNARYSSDVAVAHYRLGTYYDVIGDATNARKQFESCRDLRKQQFALSANDSNKKSLMLALARCGDLEEARVIIDALGKSTARSGELHLERARALAQLSRHLANEQERSTTIDAAFVALERAIKEGFSDPFRIMAEQDLDPLHADPRFESLVASVH